MLKCWGVFRKLVEKRRALPCRLPAPPGWYWPPAEDHDLPYPDILLPKTVLPWTHRANKNYRYGIGSHPTWGADDNLASFAPFKEDLRAFRDHFVSSFNSLRVRSGLSPTTVESESSIEPSPTKDSVMNACIVFHHKCFRDHSVTEPWLRLQMTLRD